MTFQDLSSKVQELEEFFQSGGAYNMVGEKASELISRAFPQIASCEVETKELYCRVLLILSTSLWRRGLGKEAITFAEQAIQVSQETPSMKLKARALRNAGTVMWSVSDYTKALEFYLSGLAICQDSNDKIGIAENTGNIGMIYQSLGDYTKALTYFEKALAIDKELGITSGVANGYGNLGIVYVELGDFAKSLEYYLKALVQGLDMIFSEFDILTEKYKLEKIKTIGDAYMVVSGAPIPRADHAEVMAAMALEMHEKIKKFSSTSTGVPVEIRIGIHTGEVVAGVIGKKKFAYDLWGDAVNTASRMESHSEAGKIHCSEEFVAELEKRGVGREVREPEENSMKESSKVISLSIANYQLSIVLRGEMEIKGKGMMKTYFLEKMSEL